MTKNKIGPEIDPITLKLFAAEVFADPNDDEATVAFNPEIAEEQRKTVAIVIDASKPLSERIQALEKLGFWFKCDGKFEAGQEITDKVFDLVNTDGNLTDYHWSKGNRLATAILKFGLLLAGDEYPKKLPKILTDRIQLRAAAADLSGPYPRQV